MCYPESLVEHILKEYTLAGDTVLDPFAGYGTTLVVAERMERLPFDIEINPEKVSYVRGKLSQPENLIQGDARLLACMSLPVIEFSMTSAPCTSMDDQDDALTGYRSKGQGYAAYLRDMRSVYAQLRSKMKPEGIVILEIANIKRDG